MSAGDVRSSGDVEWLVGAAALCGALFTGGGREVCGDAAAELSRVFLGGNAGGGEREWAEAVRRVVGGVRRGRGSGSGDSGEFVELGDGQGFGGRVGGALGSVRRVVSGRGTSVSGGRGCEDVEGHDSFTGSECREGAVGGLDDGVGVGGKVNRLLKKNKPGKKMRERLARQEARRVRGSDRSDWRKKEEDGEKDELRVSLETRWAAENELAAEKAKQQLAVLRTVDIGQVAKVQETKRKKVIEANMVAMEKSHAFLRATGNVPGEMGFCETVISDGGTPGLSSGSGSPVCTISPDSSASMKDYRECQKRLLDAEAKLEEQESVLKQYGLLGVVGRKKSFTVDEKGEVVDVGNLEKWFPDGYDGEILADGRFRPVAICVDTGAPYTEDGSVMEQIEEIRIQRDMEDRFVGY